MKFILEKQCGVYVETMTINYIYKECVTIW